MELLMIVMLLAEIFVMMRNVASKAELNRLRAEAVISHTDKRKWTKWIRIISGVCTVLVTGLVIYFLFNESAYTLHSGLFSWLALIFALLFFTVTPYNQQEWVITEKGIFIYNTGEFIPWGQVITTGVQPGKGKRMTRVVLQIKKEQGEMFKANYQLMGVETVEEANQISDLIRDFIRALDRKKMYKRNLEERKTELKKRKWF